MPFNEYFRRFFGEGQPRNRESTSLGSGFIISSDGYVITNNHVIRDAEEIIVSLSDRRAFKAELVGMDEQSDVALLKIDVKDLLVEIDSHELHNPTQLALDNVESAFNAQGINLIGGSAWRSRNSPNRL